MEVIRDISEKSDRVLVAIGKSSPFTEVRPRPRCPRFDDTKAFRRFIAGLNAQRSADSVGFPLSILRPFTGRSRRIVHNRLFRLVIQTASTGKDPLASYTAFRGGMDGSGAIPVILEIGATLTEP